MDYDEKIIDGVLHYRTAANGGWIPYSEEELTAKLTEARRSQQMIVAETTSTGEVFLTENQG